jgi:cysteine-rich repeat protein
MDLVSRLSCVLGVAVAVGCHQVDYSAGGLAKSCATGSEVCPSGTICERGVCLATGLPLDAGPAQDASASSPDSGVVRDAASGVVDAGASCGNGIIEDFEQCDDGNQVQTDACLNDCSAARCGDGFVHNEVEECDPAADATDPRCNEECDLSDSASACQSLHFLGCGGVTVPASNHVVYGPQFTIEAWFRWGGDARVEHQRIYTHSESDIDANGRVSLSVSYGNTLRLQVGNQNIIDTAFADSDQWHHVAGVYDQGEISLYLDGGLIQTRGGEAPPDLTLRTASIGHNSIWECDYPFNGWIGPVRLSDSARYLEGFEPVHELGSDDQTIALWDLGATVDGVVPDLGPHGIHAESARLEGGSPGACIP